MQRVLALCVVLAIVNGVVAGPKALDKCPGSPTGAPVPLSSGSIVVDTVTATVVLVQSDTDGYSVTNYGAPDFGVGDGNIQGSSGCIQISIPVGGSVDLLANSGSEKVNLGALTLTSLKISVDSGSSVISASPIKVTGPCNFRSNSKSRLVIWESTSVCTGAVTLFADSGSDLALFGTYSSPGSGVTVELLNSQAKVFIGAVPSSINILLMDSASGLRVAGTPTLVVTGKQMSPSTTIRLLSGTCGAGLINCKTVPSDIGFWDNGAFFNDPELNS